MITVSRLNGKKIIINALLIESIEEIPDTVITLTTGNKMIVLERAADVVSLVTNYMRSIGSVRASVRGQETEGS